MQPWIDKTWRPGEIELVKWRLKKNRQEAAGVFSRLLLKHNMLRIGNVQKCGLEKKLGKKSRSPS
jgi:hypothetical protein